MFCIFLKLKFFSKQNCFGKLFAFLKKKRIKNQLEPLRLEVTMSPLLSLGLVFFSIWTKNRNMVADNRELRHANSMATLSQEVTWRDAVKHRLVAGRTRVLRTTVQP